jgi:hypothetical protein
MDRSRFDIRAAQLQADVRELQVTTEDCVAQATKRVSGVNPTGLAGASPDESGASLALGRVCRRIEDVMAAYDRLQQALGGEPRYERVLEQLGARSEPGASSPVPSD